MKINTTKIRALTTDTSTWSPDSSSDSQFEYIDISAIDNEAKVIKKAVTICEKDAPSRARQLVKIGDVLVSTVRPNLNAVAMVTDDLDGAIASTGYCVLRPKADVLHHRYLYHWVRTGTFIRNMVENATGATYPAVSDRIVMNSEIPHFTLAEQRRIAAILDKADGIRRKRQAALKLADEFLRSVFLDMFGDPVTNPKRWPEKQLHEIADIASGVTKGKNYAGKKTVLVPYMRVASVQDGYLKLDDITNIEVTHEDVDRYRLVVGDLLLTEGGDPDKLGRGAIWKADINDCIHQNHIFRVRADLNQVLPDFLSALVGSSRGKAYFLRAAKQTTGIASINMTQLRAFPALVPPVKTQANFVKVIEQFSKAEQTLEKQLKLDSDLFNALVQRAFRGEL